MQAGKQAGKQARKQARKQACTRGLDMPLPLAASDAAAVAAVAAVAPQVPFTPRDPPPRHARTGHAIGGRAIMPRRSIRPASGHDAPASAGSPYGREGVPIDAVAYMGGQRPADGGSQSPLTAAAHATAGAAVVPGDVQAYIGVTAARVVVMRVPMVTSAAAAGAEVAAAVAAAGAEKDGDDARTLSSASSTSNVSSVPLRSGTRAVSTAAATRNSRHQTPSDSMARRWLSNRTPPGDASRTSARSSSLLRGRAPRRAARKADNASGGGQVAAATPAAGCCRCVHVDDGPLDGAQLVQHLRLRRVNLTVGGAPGERRRQQRRR